MEARISLACVEREMRWEEFDAGSDWVDLLVVML